MIKSKILGLYIGKPQQFRGAEQSSIGRTETYAPVFLSKMGLDGDQVADTKNHGGTDKALHLYPIEHYDRWRNILGDHDMLNRAGAFGENISADAMTEDKIKVGDQFKIGDAIIECSHGRQPCWKIEHHFGQKQMVIDILKHGHCGLYFRIVQEGVICAADIIEQIKIADHDWTVAKIFNLLYSDDHANRQDDLYQLLGVKTLASAWKKRAQSLIK